MNSSNMLKKRLKEGKACVNGWLAIPSGFSAEVMAQCGWDSVTVDMQHGVQDYQSMVHASRRWTGTDHPAGARAVERARHHRQGARRRRLGYHLPDGQHAAEAKALVTYCLYPPRGKRSNGPIRAAAYGEATPYQATANDEVLIIPMIETQEAIDNIDAILDVPGISGIYIGPKRPRTVAGTQADARPRERQILEIYDKLLRP